MKIAAASIQRGEARAAAKSYKACETYTVRYNEKAGGQKNAGERFQRYMDIIIYNAKSIQDNANKSGSNYVAYKNRNSRLSQKR
jgi:hypothetical protein